MHYQAEEQFGEKFCWNLYGHQCW